MRSLCTCVLVLAVVAVAAPAQNPPASPAPAPADPRLDIVLSNWEKAMLNVQSLSAEVKRTKLDKTYQTTELFEGTAHYLRGGAGQTSRASMELFKKSQPQVFEKYLCTGNFLYEWAPASKVIRRHELPTPKQGQLADDNFLSFLFGMKAEHAKARYQMTYVPAPANDKWYQYLRIQPKHAADKVDFTEARLVLLASNYLPRQLWFLQPEGHEVTWDFPRVTSPSNLGPQHFAHPQLPADWKLVPVPLQNPQPRVLRNSGQK
ncbi:MAG: TIGR03009 domain-containing protein [Gemmataceae bacterium]|nr:TIGR03009 domain-containing protein [Gemmataceae bacterium]